MSDRKKGVLSGYEINQNKSILSGFNISEGMVSDILNILPGGKGKG